MIMRKLAALICFTFAPAGQVFAQYIKKRAAGVGNVADNMMTPVTLFSDLVYTGCLVIGASFLFASIIKYREHRRSPLMVPMSTVVFLLIAGILLVLLPFLSYIDASALRYSLFH